MTADWLAEYGAEGVHVHPLNDLIGHSLTPDCPCGPELELVPCDDGCVEPLHHHHALDGRDG